MSEYFNIDPPEGLLDYEPEPCEVCQLVDCRCSEDEKIAHYLPKVTIKFDDFSDENLPF